MKQSFTLIATFIFLNTIVSSQASRDSQLIVNIKAIIKPQFREWVVFSNGTYLVITADSSTSNLNRKASKILGRVCTGCGKLLYKSNYVNNFDETTGWIVDSDIDGLYTFVGVDELLKIGKGSPKEDDIIARAIEKRKKDRAELQIIYESY